MSRRSRPDLARVLDEPVIYLMWPRAALMQLAHAGVAPTEVESGVYGVRGAGRWSGTVNYLRTAVAGDEDSVRDLVREVNKDLDFVEGDYPATLPRSTSDDPEHVTAGDVAAQVFATYSMPWRYVRHLPRIRLLTWGMAGERLRSIYGVEWSAGHEHRFRRTVPTVRLRQGLCPGPIRRRHGRRQRIRRATRLRRTAVTDPHTNGRNDR
ncbi:MULTISPECIES: oxygenase MpaB family protein [Gordonia]|uniref:oxygenase MpaB family protein n=1 Tax=Gordonia TaxID=2053 RepID=UPI002E2BB096|nr:oxygenase MpaB family protein [Gordonia sp. YY1]